MKILDRYILVTFLKTFFSVFIIFMFIFILQGVWLYIAELAGKDLDIAVTARFILYYMPKLIPLVVPLTVLLSSIMVFGNFAENYEFAAMKSSGISLQRAMRSLSVFIVGLGITCFFFANNVIPWGEYEFHNLRLNIRKTKPAMALVEGQFNDFGSINIKVDKKTGPEGKDLEGVIIHQKGTTRTGNYKVIVSEKGKLKSSLDSNILQLELTNGNYYEEVKNKDVRKNQTKPHVRSYFDTYTINVDLETLDDKDVKKETGRYSMLPIDGLLYTIDSLELKKKNDYTALSNTLYNRSTFKSLYQENASKKTDSVFEGNILDVFSTRNKTQILNLAITSAKSSKQVLDSNILSLEKKDFWLNKYVIALHDKFILGIACIVLFFVGAPLGALIRKGGLGLPIVIAILLFLTYHFFGIFAKNSAEKGSFSPAIGAWLSTAVMLPLSIYLTRHATNDKSVFKLDGIIVPIKLLFTSKRFQLSESETKLYNIYKKKSTSELLDIFNTSEKIYANDKTKDVALHALLNQKKSLEILSEEGLDIPKQLLNVKPILKDYKDYTNTCLVSFTIGAVLLILHFVFNNNKLPELAEAAFSLSIISFIFFGIYTIVEIVFYSKLYKALIDKKKANPIVHFLLLPLYPIKYLILRNKVKNDFYQSCFENIK